MFQKGPSAACCARTGELAMSEVMDLMVKIGVTEEVTLAFHSTSNLMEKLHAQSKCEPIAALAARPKKVGRIFGLRRWISAVPDWR